MGFNERSSRQKKALPTTSARPNPPKQYPFTKQIAADID